MTAELKESVRRLGGHITEQWTDECDFLVMERLTITSKVKIYIQQLNYLLRFRW